VIVKFFRGGRTFNGAKSAIKYLLDERQTEGTAQVFKGDPKLTLNIIKQIKNKWKFSSGVLSFEELIQDDEVLNEIIQEFENTFFAGLKKNQYNITWIKHTDKGRTELHFIAPRLELTTQKAYNPYFIKKDFIKKDLFQDYINSKFTLSSPHQAEKQNLIKIQNPNWKTKKSEFLKQVDEYVGELIKNGFIQSRDDIVYYLKNEGLEVKESKNYIAVKTAEMKKFARLKGEIYVKDFTDFGKIETNQRTREQSHCNPDYRKYREELEKFIQRDKEYNQKRYKNTPTPTNTTAPKREQQLDITNNNNNNVSIYDMAGPQQQTTNIKTATNNNEEPKNNIQLTNGGLKIMSNEENKKILNKLKRDINPVVLEKIYNINLTGRIWKQKNPNKKVAQEFGDYEEFRIKCGNKNYNLVNFLLNGGYADENGVSEIPTHTFKQIIELAPKLIQAQKDFERAEEYNREIAIQREKQKAHEKIHNTIKEAKKMNMGAFLAYNGYVLNMYKSSGNYQTWENDDNKIVIHKNEDDRYLYFNPSREDSQGDLYQLYKKEFEITNQQQIAIEMEKVLNMGENFEYEVIKKNKTKAKTKGFTKLTATSKTLSKTLWQVSEMFNKTPNIEDLPNTIRGIKKEYILQAIEQQQIAFNNGKFYFKTNDENGYSGAYVVNKDLKTNKSFIQGSKKSLWTNRKLSLDIDTIYITESPIDSLSLKQLEEEHNNIDTKTAMFISSFGGPSISFKNTFKKITKYLKQKYNYINVKLGYDNDTAGTKFRADLKDFIQNDTELNNFIELRDITPNNKDWNEDLQQVVKNNPNVNPNDYEIKRG
jgi:hypothetical protein